MDETEMVFYQEESQKYNRRFGKNSGKNSDDFGGNRPSLQKTKDQRIIKNNHSETANICWEIRCGCIWKGESSSGMKISFYSRQKMGF